MNIGDCEYGYCFHVYLRKYVDTTSSVLLWNMINCLIDLDQDAAKKDRVWYNFCIWCDAYWKANPETPFFDVALKWIKTRNSNEVNGCPVTGAAYMFQAALQMACKETIEDMNVSNEYTLGEL